MCETESRAGAAFGVREAMFGSVSRSIARIIRGTAR